MSFSGNSAGSPAGKQAQPLTGALAALVTPYDQRGEIEVAVLRDVIEFQLAQGLSGFLVAGSTGEGLLLDLGERRRLTEAVVGAVRGRAAVVIHVGALATRDAAALARHAQEAGATAVAAIPPIYFQGSAAQIVRYYEAVAGASTLPFYAYHIPSSTGVVLHRDVMAQVVRLPNVVGMKYTDSHLDEMYHLATQLAPGFHVLYGRDEMLAAGLLMGAVGGVGSTYNVMPGVYAAICRLAQEGAWKEARQLQAAATRVVDVLKPFGVFPALKAILRQAGFPVGTCRAPIEPLRGREEDLLAALRSAGYADLPGVVPLRRL